MNTPTQRDFLAQKEYYKDQMRAAAQYRLAREAQTGREREEPLYASALQWLGQRLVIRLLLPPSAVDIFFSAWVMAVIV